MRQRNRMALLVIVGLCGVAILYWAKGFYYLIDGPGGAGAIDLRQRWIEQQYVIHRQNPFDVYFAAHGGPEPSAARNGRDASVIGEVGTPGAAGYPAWSFFSGYLFFPLPWRATRIYFAGIQLPCLLWLLRWAFLQGRQVDAWCGAFCAASVAATASFCTTLGNGQYGILVLALLAASLQLDEAGWQYAAGLLAGIACLKPNITGPFLLCFVARQRWRAIVAALTYLAAASLWVWAAIHTNPVETLGQMMRGGERFAEVGYGPVSIAIGLGMKPQTATPLIALAGASLSLILCATFSRRPALDLFAIAGVTARLWTYHQNYDNLSVIFLLVALARTAWSHVAWTRDRCCMMIALGAVGASLWLPARFTDRPWFQVMQCFAWIGGVVVLLSFPATFTAREFGSRPALSRKSPAA